MSEKKKILEINIEHCPNQFHCLSNIHAYTCIRPSPVWMINQEKPLILFLQRLS